MNHYTAQLYKHYAELAKMFATPRRLELLELLAQAPRAVEALSQATGMSVANTSQHLQHLRRAHLVTSEKQGLQVIYRLSSPQVQQFLQSLANLAQSQVLEVKHLEHSFHEEWGQWQEVDSTELQSRLKDGAVLLDVRPAEEFAAGHIPGAISLPLHELKLRMDELPEDIPLVTYCRGPYCLFALEALQQLSKTHQQLMHYRVGYAGYLLETAS